MSILPAGGGRYYEAPELSLGAKLLRLNWLLVALIAATAGIGFLMLYSVAGGDLDPWARVQIVRFALGFGAMILIALIDLRLWRLMAGLIYALALGLLIAVELFGSIGGGAQRWLEIGPLRLQPSEFMKVALVLALAAYYHWLGPDRVNRPLWIAAPLILALTPAALVASQPDLGTALLLILGAGVVMFLAGVSWWFFSAVLLGAAAGGYAVAVSRGTDWQILKDYQYRRIETFLNPGADLRGAGYNIRQSEIAIGSGGLDGKGFLEGSQKSLLYLPEPHTDFIFASLAEEFGFRGGIGLLALYMVTLMVATASSFGIASSFGRLLVGGVLATFFFFFAINMAMVMGLAPVVGVPLPLVSFGGTSMMVILFGFGLALCAMVHRDDPMRRR
ncbi:MAG: rod shape-determining protein RodA [Pseudomonadota bacterium]